MGKPDPAYSATNPFGLGRVGPDVMGKSIFLNFLQCALVSNENFLRSPPLKIAVACSAPDFQ